MTRITRAVIPAAGLGTRFLPMTRSMPKEMLPVGSKPVIQYVIEEAVDAGITECLIITGRGKRAVEDYFDRSDIGDNEENARLDALIDQLDIYFVRQKSPRGLGDALRYAEPFTSGEPFVVLLGDTFTRPSCLPGLIEGYRRHRVSTIAVQPVPEEVLDRYGVVAGTPCGSGELRITDLVEKPSPRNAPSNLAVLGSYLLTPSIFPALARTRPGKNGEIQLTDALRGAAEAGRLVGCISTGRRYDIGEPLSWLLANIELGLTDPKTHRAVRELLEELGIRHDEPAPQDRSIPAH